MDIMMDYGEEVETMIMDGITEIKSLIDSDHAQHDIMFLVKKNGMICYYYMVLCIREQ